MIGKLNPWITEWRRPLVRALYLRDEAAWRATLAAAWEAHSALAQDTHFDTDGRQAIRFEFLYLQQQGLRVFAADPAQQRQHFEEALRLLSEAAAGPMSQVAQNYFTLVLRCAGQRFGYGVFEPEEFGKLFEQIPQEERDNQFWHHVSGWAFLNRQLGYLELAFEMQLTHAAKFAGDFDWQRTNLMYRITAGTAVSQDVDEHIKRMFALPHVSEFREILWPRIEEAQLASAELWEAFEARAREIAEEPQAPGRETSTRSVLSQHNRP